MGWNKSKEDFNSKTNNEQECLHKQCEECHGTGKKSNGQMCIHFISCPCTRCTPQCKSI